MPKKATQLTDTIVRKAKCKPGERSTEFPDLYGLRLRVTSTGHKSWSMKFVSPEILVPETTDKKTGKVIPEHYAMRRLPLGVYFDQGGGVSLDEARDRARAARKQIEDHIDPLEQMTRDGQARRNQKTVQEVFDIWSKWKMAQDNIKASTADQSVSAVRNHVLPVLGSLLIANITGAHYDEVLLPHVEQSKADPRHKPLTNRIHLYMSDLFDFAVTKSHIKFNPFGSHSCPFTKFNTNERFLNLEEIKKVWDVAGKMETRHTGPILQLLLATGQRIGSVCAMKRDCIDIDKKLWVIPMTDIKNGEKKRVNHPVPLNALALEIVKKAMKATNGNVLFPNAKGNSIAVTKIDAVVCSSQVAFDIPKWVPHTCRHTFVTWALNKRQGGCALNRQDVKRAIAHAIKEDKDTMGTVYTHNDLFEDHEFIDEITAVQQEWGKWLRNIVDPVGGGKVVPIRSAA